MRAVGLVIAGLVVLLALMAAAAPWLMPADDALARKVARQHAAPKGWTMREEAIAGRSIG